MLKKYSSKIFFKIYLCNFENDLRTSWSSEAIKKIINKFEYIKIEIFYQNSKINWEKIFAIYMTKFMIKENG